MDITFDKMRETTKKTLRTMLLFTAIYTVGNVPEFVRTYNLPTGRIKPTLAEQLRNEENKLRDISGGVIYANFRLGGICAGYITRKVLNF